MENTPPQSILNKNSPIEIGLKLYQNYRVQLKSIRQQIRKHLYITGEIFLYNVGKYLYITGENIYI